MPEALENQLIADLESSFVEEDSDGDIYVDGEAKKYAEVSLYAKTKTKGGKVKEKSILETVERYTISAPSFNHYILPVLTHFSQNIDFLYIYNPY